MRSKTKRPECFFLKLVVPPTVQLVAQVQGPGLKGTLTPGTHPKNMHLRHPTSFSEFGQPVTVSTYSICYNKRPGTLATEQVSMTLPISHPTYVQAWASECLNERLLRELPTLPDLQPGTARVVPLQSRAAPSSQAPVRPGRSRNCWLSRRDKSDEYGPH